MLRHLKRFWYEEDGLGIVEIALIIIVLIALAVIFKKELVGLIEDIFGRVGDNLEEMDNTVSE